MSKSVSIYQSELTFSKNKINQLIKSIKHSMRIDYEEKNINYNYDKSGENKIFIYNGNDELQGIQGKDLSFEKRELLLQQLENLLIENEYQVMDAKVLSNLKRDFKSALKTDEDAIKKRKPRDEHLTNEQLTRRKELTEKIFKYLNDGLKGNVLKDKEMLEYLELVPKKRFDKVLKIKNENLNKQSFDNKTIQAIESIFKIPVENDVDLSAEESRIINEDFYKTHFPNYEIVASFEHNDEKLEKLDIKGNVLSVKVGGDHTHNFLKAKNKLTGEYDYSKTKYNLVVEQLRKEWDGLETKEDFKNWYFNSYFELENIPEDFLNLKTEEQRIKYLIGDLTKKDKRYVKTQNKRFGTIYQNIVFDFVNKHHIFKNRGLKAEKFLFMGDTREEIFKNKNKLSLQDKNLKNKRDFNGLELAKENTQKMEEYIKILEDKNNKLDKSIEKLENQVADYERTINEIKDEALKEVNEDLEIIKDKIKKSNENLTKLEEDYKNKKTELENKLSPLNNKLFDKTREKEEIEKFLNEPTNKLAMDFLKDDEENPLFSKFKELKINQKEFKAFKEVYKITDDVEYWGNLLNDKKNEIEAEARNEIYNKISELRKDETEKVKKEILDLNENFSSLSSNLLNKSIELTSTNRKIKENDEKLNKQIKYIKKIDYIENMKKNLTNQDKNVLNDFIKDLNKNPELLEMVLLEYSNLNNNFDKQVKQKNDELDILKQNLTEKENNFYEDFIKDFKMKKEEFPNFESLKKHFINIHNTRLKSFNEKAELEKINKELNSKIENLETNNIILTDNYNQILKVKEKFESKSLKLETENQELTTTLTTKKEEVKEWKNSYSKLANKNDELEAINKSMIETINNLRELVPEIKKYLKNKIETAKDFINSINVFNRNKNK